MQNVYEQVLISRVDLAAWRFPEGSGGVAYAI
jgi:hypothetical protein